MKCMMSSDGARIIRVSDDEASKLYHNENYSYVATFPCDTPFFDVKIIDKLKKASEDKVRKLFFFKSGEKRHNIFGLWSIELLNILEEDINNNYRKVELWADKIGFEII